MGAISFALPYDAPLNVPTVPVQIGGRTVPILLDTGDDAFGFEVRSSELGDAALHRTVAGSPGGSIIQMFPDASVSVM